MEENKICEVSYQLYFGDCIDTMQQLMEQNVRVNAIISDPPYNINQADWDCQFDLYKCIDLFKHLLLPNSNIILFQGWSNVSNTKSYMDSRFTIQDWIIYDRVKGRGSKRHLVSTREDILWYTNGDNYTFNKIPSTIKKKTSGLGLKNGCEFRALSNVWTDISPIVPWSSERVKHPTQKPLQLMQRCIQLWTNKGDTILDFTMGSGTTGEAALQNDRKFIGIENNKEYFAIAKKRIEKICK